MLGGAIGNLTVACFAAGTPLVVDFEGNSRSIEEIDVGDYVLARSEFDAAGPLELKRVEEKFVRVAPVMELVVRGQVITTTAEHPFFVAGEERFVPARELTLEDSLVDSQGRSVAMDAIRVTDRLITVYNLRVADFHTYFVGGKLWKFDAWVHNAGDIYDPSEIAPIEGAGGFTGRFAKMDPTDLQFSQRSAGGNGRAAQLRESMSNGWNGKAVDAVETPHGITTIDNTRIAVAQELGIPQVPVMVRQMSDPLPESMLGRFGNSKTWGEALQYRTGNQRPPLPSTGTPTRPRLPGS